MIRLTRDLGAAVAEGDLDGALRLLEERRQTLERVTWPEEAEAEFWEQFRCLRSLEEEIKAFCRTWREVVAERLKALHHGRFLRLTYGNSREKCRFIDVSR
ncbi:MAG: flagellar protein FliT [Desulfobaccales bacterium]